MKKQRQNSYIAWVNRGGGGVAGLQAPQIQNLKNIDSVAPMTSDVSRDLLFSRSSTLKFWKINLKINKNQEEMTLWLSHRTCSYICRYINEVANSVMLQLYLRHGFCNKIFKVKRKLYTASVSAVPSEILVFFIYCDTQTHYVFLYRQAYATSTIV